MLKLTDQQLLRSAHDCSDGGLAVAIVECCFSSLGRDAIGADITLAESELSNEALLFAETPSRVVISFASADLEKVYETVQDCPFEVIGKVGGEKLSVNSADGEVLSLQISELESLWTNSLESRLSASTM